MGINIVLALKKVGCSCFNIKVVILMVLSNTKDVLFCQKA